MNWHIVRAIAVKDWQEVRQNRMAWAPTLIVPLIFCVLLPLAITIGPGLLNAPQDQLNKMDEDFNLLLNALPPLVRNQLDGMNGHQLMIVLLLGFMLAPMFLILPLMTSTVIGSDSFVGEKERKTIEALVYTPATERELFFGKMIAAVVPAVLLTWIGFLLYTLIVNVAGNPIVGRSWFPTPPWWPLILWVTPAVALMGMAAAVLISSRVSTFMEAYQNTGMLVIPLILLVIGQISGALYLSPEIMFIIGLVLFVLDAGLIALSLKLFSRARLMGAEGPDRRG